MGRKTVGLVGLWDCVAFDEVAGIKFKDKDGIQIMKDLSLIHIWNITSTGWTLMTVPISWRTLP